MTTALKIAQRAVQLADENPHFIYEVPGKYCVYVHEGKGSCLFGQAAVAEGVPAEALDVTANIGFLFGDLIREGIIEGSQNDWHLFDTASRAQRLQDSGTEWGDAVAELREYLAKIPA